jgi:3-oxoacyl-[acyl-carrier-protein] synthase II
VSQKIVVTGVGVTSPLGMGVADFAAALWSGKSGIAPSPRFPETITSEFGELNPAPWLGNKGVRVLDRGTRLLCIAAQMVLTETCLSQEKSAEGDPDLGLVCGTMFGGVHSIATFDWSSIVEGPSLVSPMDFPNTVINAPAGQAAIKHKLRGVNSTVCAGLASGLYAINYAAEFLRFGRARWLMAGGMEEVCDEAALGFRKLGLVSASNSVEPFGDKRDGTAAGEGAALWMLETEETANAAGRKPMFEICGFGSGHGSAAEVIAQALEETGINPDQIGCIVASANGSRAGDEAEAQGIRAVLGTDIPVTAPKAAIGEVMGGSGAFAAVIAGLALERREAPPTANLHSTNTGLKLSAQPQPFKGDYALVNAFSCEGNNASLVIRCCE